LIVDQSDPCLRVVCMDLRAPVQRPRSRMDEARGRQDMATRNRFRLRCFLQASLPSVSRRLSFILLVATAILRVGISQPPFRMAAAPGFLQVQLLRAKQVRTRSPTSDLVCHAVLRPAPAVDYDQEDSEAEERDTFAAADSNGRRLDVFLHDHYTSKGQTLSRSYIEALIDRGAVHVNGKIKKKAFRGLRDGDLVDVRFLLDEKTLQLEPEAIPLVILHEDESLLIIDKPAGLVVHPAPGNWKGTLVNAVLHHLAEASGGPLPDVAQGAGARLRPGIVHRLDVGTSGVIAVAKTSATFAALSQAFARREVEKTYLAVVSGGRQAYRGHQPGSGYVIDMPVGRSTLDRRKMAVIPESSGGRPCVSLVRAVAEERETSLLEVRPRTGRTHQIRVHLSASHTPVLGDPTYGGPAANRRFAGLATRSLLHAHRLAFKHPASGERLEFESSLPPDMQRFVQRMKPLEEEDVPYWEQLLQGKQPIVTRFR